nr:MAG TPA: hypothetical protein [Caudoviricetes sp.]
MVYMYYTDHFGLCQLFLTVLVYNFFRGEKNDYR